MATRTKIKEFFEGRRRKASLLHWMHLKTKANESRIKLSLKIPLLNENVLGMPAAISSAFGVMSQDNSDIARTKLNIYCEGMTVEFFTADTSKSPNVSTTGGILDKMAIVASGAGEKRAVDLELVAYIPAGEQLRDWAWNHLHGSFFMEAVYSQSEMEFSEADDPEDDEDEDDDEGVPEPAVAEPAVAEF